MFRGGLVNVIGTVIRLIAVAASVPLLIRELGVEGYGLWTLASAILGVAMLAEGGLTVSSTYFMARALVAGPDVYVRNEVSRAGSVIVSAMLLFASLAAIVLVVSAVPLARLLSNLRPDQKVELALALKWGAIVVWARLMQQPFIGAQQAHGAYVRSGIINSVQACCTSAGSVYIASIHGGSAGIMQLFSEISLVALGVHVASTYGVYRNLAPTWQWHGESARKILRYSALTWIASLGSASFAQCDRLVVNALLGLESLGIYSAILNLTNQINNLSGIAIQPLLPALSKALSESDKMQANASIFIKLRSSVNLNMLIAFGLAMSFVAGADQIVQVIHLDQRKEYSVALLQAAAVVYALYSLNAPGYYVMLSANSLPFLALSLNLIGLATLAVIAMLALRFGLVGAIVGNIVFGLTLSFNIYGWRILKLKPSSWLKMLLIPTLIFSASVLVSISFPTGITRWAVLFTCLLLLSLYSLPFDRKRFLTTSAKVG
jgi:O-antigen/teichoic acid export membrane protein